MASLKNYIIPLDSHRNALFHPLVFVCRYVLLGISDVKKIFLTDTIGAVLKFVLGYVLVAMNFGTYGVLLSFLIPIYIYSRCYLVFASNICGLRLGNMKFIKELSKRIGQYALQIIREGNF